jgi:hypothetical protein
MAQIGRLDRSAVGRRARRAARRGIPEDRRARGTRGRHYPAQSADENGHPRTAPAGLSNGRRRPVYLGERCAAPACASGLETAGRRHGGSAAPAKSLPAPKRSKRPSPLPKIRLPPTPCTRASSLRADNYPTWKSGWPPRNPLPASPTSPTKRKPLSTPPTSACAGEGFKDNPDLQRFATEIFGGDRHAGKWNIKQVYDLLEGRP